MKNENNTENNLKKAILSLPIKIATKSANSTCGWMLFEDKPPVNLNKLKKQNGK